MGDGSEWEVCESCRLLRPATPPQDSCCGSGCSLCVFDIHDQEMRLWRRNCQREHAGQKDSSDNEDESSNLVMDPLEYRDFVLESIKPVCANTAIYRFALPTGRRLDLAIAKHIILRGSAADGRIITRQYTPISLPEARGYFDVLIKLYAHGEMSLYISHWRVGDKAKWRGTFGSFTYQPNQYQRVLMIAGGTGITPIIQVIRHILEDDMDETVIRLLYSSCSYSNILLRDDLNELALFWNVTIDYFLSQDSPTTHSVDYGETIHHSHITKETVSKELESATGQTVRVLVCGTRQFEDDMITYLKEIGMEEKCITKF